MLIPEPPETFPGFESINRYWDAALNSYVAKISPGEFYVTNQPEIIGTTLGSCVSACIRDRINHIGGMNHFLLPLKDTVKREPLPRDILAEAMRYGNWAMEYLINEILKYGGKRENLEVKIFGGSHIIQNMSAIGESNIEFVLKYIKNEKMVLLSQDVGDVYPRKILFFPQTGVVKVKKLRTIIDSSIVKQEQEYLHAVKNKPISGDVELF